MDTGAKRVHSHQSRRKGDARGERLKNHNQRDHRYGSQAGAVSLGRAVGLSLPLRLSRCWNFCCCLAVWLAPLCLMLWNYWNWLELPHHPNHQERHLQSDAKGKRASFVTASSANERHRDKFITRFVHETSSRSVAPARLLESSMRLCVLAVSFESCNNNNKFIISLACSFGKRREPSFHKASQAARRIDIIASCKEQIRGLQTVRGEPPPEVGLRTGSPVAPSPPLAEPARGSMAEFECSTTTLTRAD